ncbi:MAG: hypothetical protein IH586_02570 [Anaerolineaceae bacterium]|nr:hypothetical protein [Anaerolineaceae bacterium]
MNFRELSLRLVALAKADLLNFFSLLVFFCATTILFRSVEFALVVAASLGFHELGHAAALAWLHLDFRIQFGLVGAWTWSSSAERAQLSHFTNTIIHLAGPLFSLLLALAAVGLHVIWRPDSGHLLILANFSAQVGFFNLLPLGPLTDGGKALRRVSAALEGTLRLRAVLLLIVVTVGMLVMYGLVVLPEISVETGRSFLFSLVLVGFWLASSLLIQTLHPEPETPLPIQPIKPHQVYLLILLIWDILTFCLVVMSATPFWLAPQYVRGYIDNITWVVTLVARIVVLIH